MILERYGFRYLQWVYTNSLVFLLLSIYVQTSAILK
jgi:hypothetical protein